MKHIILLLFFSVAIFSQTRTGVIKGSVIDKDNPDNLMTGANVILLNSTLGAASDVNGNYEIKNVPLGKYIVKCSFIAYATQIDTIELTEENPEITKDFYLSFNVPILMPDSIREYHKLFAEYKPEEILNILIDSLSEDYSSLYISYTNKSKYTVYLIESIRFFETISIFMRDDKGEKISWNLFLSRCTNPVSLPKKINLIELKPFATISIPPVDISDYSIKSLPIGKYYISLKYEIKDHKYLPINSINTGLNYYNSHKEEIEVLNQATRGIYYSSNELVVEK